MAGKKIARFLVVLSVTMVSMSACVTPKMLTEGERSDPGIKARLEAKLRAEPDLDLRYVVVDVHMRIVTLSGLVASWENKRDIDRIARRLQGVDHVVSNLVVQE